MQYIWEEKYKVKIYDVGFDGRLKLASLFNYLQEVATNHANAIGIGKESLEAGQFYWVLSRMHVEIYDTPKFTDQVRVVTWPKTIDKIYAIRDFEVYGNDGQIIANGTSSWLILDAVTLKPQRPKVLADGFKTVAMSAIKEVAKKIKPLKEVTVSHIQRAHYSHIDVNNHVNNAKYIEWICDVFDGRFFKLKAIKDIEINYVSQVKWQEEILIRYKTNYEGNGSLIYVDGYNKNTDTVAFTAIVQIEDYLTILREDQGKNQNMINFVNGYPVIKSERAGEKGLLIQGISDEPWIYFSCKEPKTFRDLLGYCSNQDLYYANLEPWMKDILLEDRQVHWEMSCIMLVLLDRVVVAKNQLESGFRLDVLTEENVAFIFENSKYSEFTSPAYIKHRIQQGIGFGIYDGNELLAWVLTHDDGAIGFLNVLEKYRRRGFGQVLTTEIIEAVRGLGQVPFVCIEKDNHKSLSLAKKLGYVPSREIAWVKVL